MLFGSINAYLIWEDIQKALEKESEKRAMFIGKSIAEQVVTPLLFEDYVGVQKILDESKSLDNTVDYVFIIDEDKRVIAHTFNTRFPDVLRNINIPGSNERINTILIQLTNEDNNIVRDISLPVMEGKLGSVRLGISEAGITSDVMNTVSHFWMMVGFFLFFGVLGALMFAFFITKPINAIRGVADNLDFIALKERTIPKIVIREKLLGKIKYLFRANDEIDLLTDKFNEMIDRLEDAYINLQLAQQKLLQSEKLATIGTLSSGLAHEINNPITGIKNCLRRIQQSPDNIEQNRKYIGMMNRAVDRVEMVIKNLLSFSRKEEIQFNAVNVEEAIERVLLLVAHRLENNQISLTKEIKPGVNYIRGSLIHIEQILMNLIINAIDAIEEKENSPVKAITITTKNDENYVQLTVEDTGVGIPADKIPKIFDPFYTTKLADKGTGLGLAVISNLVESHGGKIEVESKPGIGTKFIILLPSIHRGDFVYEN